MTIDQISVFLENRPGQLEDFAKVLLKYGISMRALSLAETPDMGVLRVIVDDPKKLSGALDDEEYVYKTTPVIAAEVIDKPGGLVEILDVLAQADINLEYTYTFLGRREEAAYMILRVDDNDAAGKALAAAGVRLLDQQAINEMLK